VCKSAIELSKIVGILSGWMDGTKSKNRNISNGKTGGKMREEG